MQIEFKKVSDLLPFERNARTHSKDQVAQLVASIKQFGFTNPILVGPDGVVLAGHGRLEAAKAAGLEDVPTLTVGADWTPEQTRAYVLADNQLAANAGWDRDLLASELASLTEADFDIGVIGFTDAELAALRPAEGDDGLSAGDPEPEPEDQRGSLLKLVDITIADPKTEVHIGDHFVLAKRHHLLCCGVMKDWHLWTPLLQEGTIFCPYPGPWTPFGETPQYHPLVMVQPDAYVAGHILDHWIAVHGKRAVKKMEAK